MDSKGRKQAQTQEKTVKEIPTSCKKLAGAYCQTTGLEYEDLLQEALLGYWYAENYANYDPHKAAFETFATRIMVNGLNTVTTTHRRKFPAHSGLDEAGTVPDNREPGAEDILYIKELVRELPEDAQFVARLVLENATIFAGVAKNKIKKTLRGMLPWSASRTNKAFQQIADALSAA